ncbi:MAG TPA: hypothetical protein DD434_02840 [Bacteroidales bacterium]|nr:hypothetical protein [Bacteroidales bacterium]
MKRIIIILVSFLLFSTNVLSQNLNQNEQIHRCKVVRIRDVGKAHAISINCDCDSTGNYYMYMIIRKG